MARVAGVAGVLGYAWIAGGFQRQTWPALIAVLLPGAAVTYGVLRKPVPRASAPNGSRVAATWGVVLCAFLLWEFQAWIQQPAPTVGSYDHPTLSTLSEPVIAQRPGRALGYVLWLTAGLSLLRR